MITLCHPDRLEPYGVESVFVQCPDCSIGYFRDEAEAVISGKEVEKGMAWKKVENNFKSWEKKGEELEGTFVGTHEGQFGKVFDLETAKGMITVGGTVLSNKLEPKLIGKKIKVVFLGEEKGEKGKYKNFDVFVEE